MEKESCRNKAGNKEVLQRVRSMSDDEEQSLQPGDEFRAEDNIDSNNVYSTSDRNSNSSGGPDGDCAICLETMDDNKSFIDGCFHSFCFPCLRTWSREKAQCPICRQPFECILHNIRAMNDYDKYQVPPAIQSTVSGRTIWLWAAALPNTLPPNSSHQPLLELANNMENSEYVHPRNALVVHHEFVQRPYRVPFPSISESRNRIIREGTYQSLIFQGIAEDNFWREPEIVDEPHTRRVNNSDVREHLGNFRSSADPFLIERDIVELLSRRTNNTDVREHLVYRTTSEDPFSIERDIVDQPLSRRTNNTDLREHLVEPTSEDPFSIERDVVDEPRSRRTDNTNARRHLFDPRPSPDPFLIERDIVDEPRSRRTNNTELRKHLVDPRSSKDPFPIERDIAGPRSRRRDNTDVSKHLVDPRPSDDPFLIGRDIVDEPRSMRTNNNEVRKQPIDPRPSKDPFLSERDMVDEPCSRRTNNTGVRNHLVDLRPSEDPFLIEHDMVDETRSTRTNNTNVRKHLVDPMASEDPFSIERDIVDEPRPRKNDPDVRKQMRRDPCTPPPQEDRDMSSFCPQIYRQNQKWAHLLADWLKRKLSTIAHENGAPGPFVSDLILLLIEQHDIQSEEFYVHVKPYLRNDTDSFIQDLFNFASSLCGLSGSDNSSVHGNQKSETVEKKFSERAAKGSSRWSMGDYCSKATPATSSQSSRSRFVSYSSDGISSSNVQKFYGGPDASPNSRHQSAFANSRHSTSRRQNESADIYGRCSSRRQNGSSKIYGRSSSRRQNGSADICGSIFSRSQNMSPDINGPGSPSRQSESFSAFFTSSSGRQNESTHIYGSSSLRNRNTFAHSYSSSSSKRQNETVDIYGTSSSRRQNGSADIYDPSDSGCKTLFGFDGPIPPSNSCKCKYNLRKRFHDTNESLTSDNVEEFVVQETEQKIIYRVPEMNEATSSSEGETTDDDCDDKKNRLTRNSPCSTKGKWFQEEEEEPRSAEQVSKNSNNYNRRSVASTSMLKQHRSSSSSKSASNDDTGEQHSVHLDTQKSRTISLREGNSNSCTSCPDQSSHISEYKKPCNRIQCSPHESDAEDLQRLPLETPAGCFAMASASFSRRPVVGGPRFKFPRRSSETAQNAENGGEHRHCVKLSDSNKSTSDEEHSVSGMDQNRTHIRPAFLPYFPSNNISLSDHINHSYEHSLKYECGNRKCRHRKHKCHKRPDDDSDSNLHSLNPRNQRKPKKKHNKHKHPKYS